MNIDKIKKELQNEVSIKIKVRHLSSSLSDYLEQTFPELKVNFVSTFSQGIFLKHISKRETNIVAYLDNDNGEGRVFRFYNVERYNRQILVREIICAIDYWINNVDDYQVYKNYSIELVGHKELEYHPNYQFNKGDNNE